MFNNIQDCRQLNQHGYLTRRNKQFSATTVYGLLAEKPQDSAAPDVASADFNDLAMNAAPEEP